MRPLHSLLCLTAAISLSAQDTAPRIGMMVPERIIASSAHARKLFAELDNLKKTLDERLQAKSAEIQKVSSQLQSPSISEAGKETLQKQLRDLDFENKKLQDDAQIEFQKTQQRVVGQFQREVSPIVDALAKEQKLQLVLQYQPGLVAYADQAWLLSFSDEIAKRYDAKFETGGAGAAPKAPAAKPAAAPKPAAKPPVPVVPAP
jgi:Skp family chaperone for outer membrane proteins